MGGRGEWGGGRGEWGWGEGVRGVGGRANTTIAELKGAKTIHVVILQMFFSSAKNDIVLSNFIILGGSGGMLL